MKGERPVRGMRMQCTEAWEDMLPLENGRDRHCTTCAKPVIDFTTWNDDAMRAWFRAHPDTCGQFRIDQVQRDLVPVPDLGRDVLRGATAALAALTLLAAPAQNVPNTPAATEQTPASTTTQAYTPLLPKGADDRCWESGTERATATPTTQRRPRYFLSPRFPFIHRARTVRGKRIIGCPSF